MAKGTPPPCKNKECGHAEAKHYTKGGGRCILRDCPCDKYRGS